MAQHSWQGKNANVWYIAGIIFLATGILSLVNDMTVYALGSLAIALAFFAIASDTKKKNKVL